MGTGSWAAEAWVGGRQEPPVSADFAWSMDGGTYRQVTRGDSEGAAERQL
jgi:hypothetical protein